MSKIKVSDVEVEVSGKNGKRKNRKVMTRKHKVIHIEQSPEKDYMRDVIKDQTYEFLDYMIEDSKDPKMLTMVSLCGPEWYTEKKLHSAINNFYQGRFKTQFIGVEGDHGISPIAFKNRPNVEDDPYFTAHLANCRFAEMFNVKFRANKAGYIEKDPNGYDKKSVSMAELFEGVKDIHGKPINLKRKNSLQIIWLDLCAEINIQDMKDFAYQVSMVKYGLVYITFCKRTRWGGKSEAVFRERLQKYSKSKDLDQIVLDALEYFINKANGNKKRELIMSISYRGGKSNVQMITVGYSIGIENGAVGSVFKDRTDFNKHNPTRSQTGWKLSKRHGDWEVPAPKARKHKKVKVNKNKLSPEMEAELNQFVKENHIAWRTVLKHEKVKREKIAAKYGVSVHKIGSMVAWYSPKLMARRVKSLALAKA